jgi:hypothetical protein
MEQGILELATEDDVEEMSRDSWSEIGSNRLEKGTHLCGLLNAEFHNRLSMLVKCLQY